MPPPRSRPVGGATVGPAGGRGPSRSRPLRPAPKRAGRLLREFERRVGDPNVGGVPGGGRLTAYRQDALRCALHLCAQGPTKASEVARAVGVPRAARLMRDDHYGWFERVERGVYALTPAGETGLETYRAAAADLQTAAPENRPDETGPS